MNVTFNLQFELPKIIHVPKALEGLSEDAPSALKLLRASYQLSIFKETEYIIMVISVTKKTK